MSWFWPKNTKDRILRLLVSVVVASVLFVPIFELMHKAPNDCLNPNWNTTYISWGEDYGGPCTYLQRVVSTAVTILIYPLVLFYPLAIVTPLILGYSWMKHKTIPKDTRFRFAVIWLAIIAAWAIIVFVAATRGLY